MRQRLSHSKTPCTHCYILRRKWGRGWYTVKLLAHFVIPCRKRWGRGCYTVELFPYIVIPCCQRRGRGCHTVKLLVYITRKRYLHSKTPCIHYEEEIVTWQNSLHTLRGRRCYAVKLLGYITRKWLLHSENPCTHCHTLRKIWSRGCCTINSLNTLLYPVVRDETEAATH